MDYLVYHSKMVRLIDNVETGSQMCQFRKAHQIIQTQVAAAMGVSCAYVSQLEGGTSNWTKSRATQYRGIVAGLAKQPHNKRG